MTPNQFKEHIINILKEVKDIDSAEIAIGQSKAMCIDIRNINETQLSTSVIQLSPQFLDTMRGYNREEFDPSFKTQLLQANLKIADMNFINNEIVKINNIRWHSMVFTYNRNEQVLNA